MKNNRWTAACLGPAAVLLFLFATLIFLSVVGRSSRQYNPAHTVHTISKAEDALLLWRRSAFHGRTLVLFEHDLDAATMVQESLMLRYLGMKRTVPAPTERNFLCLALSAGIVRKAYQVIPDSSWPKVEETFSQYPFIARDGNRFRYTVEGVPVIVTRLDDIPSLSEKVMIYADGTSLDEYGKDKLALFLDNDRTADMVVIKDAPR